MISTTISEVYTLGLIITIVIAFNIALFGKLFAKEEVEDVGLAGIVFAFIWPLVLTGLPVYIYYLWSKRKRK